MNKTSLYTEKELFELIAVGDEAAFKQLYIQLKPMLFGFILKLTKSEEAVGEIIQESLYRLWVSRTTLATIQHPRSWFFKLVSNECYRYFRKHGLQKRLLGELENQQYTTDQERTTEMDLSYRETLTIIEQSVAALAPRQKEIYQLSRVNGLTIPQISTHLSLSENYIKKTLMLALQIIRQNLTAHGKQLPLLLIWLLS